MEALQFFGNGSESLLNKPEGLNFQQHFCENLRHGSRQCNKEGDTNKSGSDCKDGNSRNEGNEA